MRPSRRTWPIVALALVLVAGAAGATLATTVAGAGDDQTYTVVLDNAFGLTVGSDLRSAGVPVGRVKTLDVQRPSMRTGSTARALATVTVTRPDFAGFRKDVFCEVKPQSLIGEYYLDCRPGTSAEPAPRTIPVKQTAGTVPPDLVLDILRRPARERFGLILSELGMGLAARGEDLQATIRRGVPALRETDKVLQILAANRRTLQQLTHDASRVLGGLAGNRRDVARFVREAGDTTTASAQRKVQLAATVRGLPAFLRELRPTLRDLGTAAAQQTPALADLRRAAPDLETLLRRLGPFADSARPAVRGLGRASDTGIVAAREARSTVTRLRELGTVSTEPTRNLRFVLEDLDDRNRAVEPNRLSPNGKGFTGLESLLQYFFTQSQALNIYDSKSYLLKLGVLVNQCSQYTNAASAREHPARTQACNQWLGPNQPGVTSGALARSGGASTSSGGGVATPGTGAAPLTPAATAPVDPGSLPLAPPTPPPPPPPPALLPDPRKLLDLLPGVGPRPPGAKRDSRRKRDGERSLLDYLLGP
jgi:ABC-type transporter Mla subunit MlaD